MSVKKLTESVYSVGVLNPGMRVFDIIMHAEYGTSYNAYLITGEKNILVDTVLESFFDEYLENIQSIVEISKIDYLIVNHTEPDHSGSIARLLDLNPNIVVYSTFSAKKNLTAIMNREFQSVVVKQGDKLDLGGRELEFIVAPLLHWPDTMFTWMPSEKVLFTCDFLGCHYCEPTLKDSSVHYPQQYWDEFENYYKCIMAPFGQNVLAGLDKIEGLPVELVCTSHGPCLTDNIRKCKELYRRWSTPAPREKKIVGILYASAYGYTGRLACAAAEELRKNESLDVRLVDIVFEPFEKSAELVNRADALLVGSCTINRDAPKIVWDVLASIDPINTRGKPAGAFGSYGWSGEAVPMMKSRLEHLKFKFVGDGLRVNFMPTPEDLSSAREYAEQVAAQIKP
ncbi:FprA family A-type flavoprotein [Caproiciproducens sp. NJN-50]|uniref:FprA family A-type flavoprotein n=1 Tax=Acutalibacteraceae TaxID=3082771 RepID=UPI000FFE252A|nr:MULTISPECIES: FprA family A-type flavoprotein [Acutalibacteraceae]QAT48477.1 FprA family A-type flavoprotein [Caproiciproducens sp. NJN-50]